MTGKSLAQKYFQLSGKPVCRSDLVRRMVFAWIVGAFLWVGMYLGGQHITWAEDETDVVLQNAHVLWRIDSEGRTREFVDKRSQKNYAAQPWPLVAVRISGTEVLPSACIQEGDQLRVTFGADKARATLAVRSSPDYFVIRLEKYEGPEPDFFVLVNLRLALGKERNWTSGLISDGSFACCVRVADYRIGFNLGGGPEPTMTAVLYPNRSLEGAWAGVVAAPKEEIRQALQRFVTNEKVLRSPVGGPFALDAPETRGSYVFAYVTESNVDGWIELCKKANIDLIHFIGWDASHGHYSPRKDAFPEGLSSLKRTIEKIHSAGLRAGLHFLFGISPHDPYASPVPDPRLKVDARFELAEPVDETTDFLPTTVPPKDLPTVWAYMSRGNVVRVGQELIQYHALSENPPGFAQCRRGVFGTKPARHEAGTAVEHLYTIYTLFYPDEDSDLIEEIANNIAEIVNTCRADLIYMDGAEGVPGGWYGVSRMRAEVFSRLEGRVMVEASEWGYHSWTFHSRTGAWDHPNWGLKRFVDIHVRSNLEYQSASLLPTQLGWWAILGDTPDHYAELPDELEYLCVKSLAWDMPMSFQGIALGQASHGRQDEYLEMVGRYERLRLSRSLPQNVLQQLRENGREFRMRQRPDGRWELVPCKWLSKRVEVQSAGEASWHIFNSFSSQPLKLRLRVLDVAEPYDSAQAVLLTDFSSDEVQIEAAPGVHASWQAVEFAASPVSHGVEFIARNEGSSRRGAWARAVIHFGKPKDLTKTGALGVWIRGDGKQQVLNFQLSNPRYYWQTFAEHYVPVDFIGWKYVELHFKERDADRHGDYQWPYADYYAIYRNPLIRREVDRITIYYNDLPPGEEVRCGLGPIVALPVSKVAVSNPSISLNGRPVQLPVDLQTGDYAEWLQPGVIRVYNRHSQLVAELPVDLVPPEVSPGVNELTITGEVKPAAGSEAIPWRARVEVWLLLEGEPVCAW